jgi:hypothetical protein
MANVMKMAKVRSAIAFHDMLETVFFTSSLILIFCLGGGWMRSFVTRKVMMKKIKATQAKSPIVHVQPC